MAGLGARSTHIAIVMHDFSSGGSERIAIRLANQWGRSGRKVTILSGVTEGPLRALVDPVVAVIGVWPEIRRSLYSRLTLASALAEHIGLLRPDIVFAPGNFHLPVIGKIARILGPDCPATICKLSNPLGRVGRPALLDRLIAMATRYAAKPIDAVVAMSSSLAMEARAILGGRNIRHIYEPNLDAGYHPLHRTPAQREAIILCAGRLVRQKNFALAIEAFAQLDRALGARLVILGEGEERIGLEAMVDRHGLNDRVTFAGYITDIRPALSEARLFLLSSRFEGYPAVLVEALAAGVPVVTTDCSPALDEIMVDPAFGHVVSSDAGAIATAMKALIAEESGRQVDAASLADRHRIDIVALQYLDLFDEVVRSRRVRMAER